MKKQDISVARLEQAFHKSKVSIHEMFLNFICKKKMKNKYVLHVHQIGRIF